MTRMQQHCFRWVLANQTVNEDPHNFEQFERDAAIMLCRALAVPEKRSDEQLVKIIEGLKFVLGIHVDFFRPGYGDIERQEQRARARAEIEEMFRREDPYNLLARPDDEAGWNRLIDKWLSNKRKQ